MEELEKYREVINDIDKEMAALFEKRMGCAKLIAEYKRENNLPVKDEKREAVLILRNKGLLKDRALDDYYEKFFKSVLDVSCEYQEHLIKV
ncbi:MAG: chorismate mutase [Lachnospiraceae bacterium]|nr:chorismate mutase [Lachnospiraceae bacterium]